MKTMREIEFFSGLPNYFGGKRKLAKLIASLCKGDVFCDLFLGGGSVGLYLKAQEKKVLSCDHSYLSKCIGKAFIENNNRKLTREDLQLLSYPSGIENRFVRDTFYPDLFTERHARWIDNALTVAENTKSEITKSLYKMLIAKFIFSLRAFGSFTSLLYMQAYNFKDEDEILHRSHGYYKNLSITTYELAERVLEDVNSSVFTNGQLNKFHYGDVFEFAQEVDCDTVYLDPPYYKSDPYEVYYNVINRILTLDKWEKMEQSVFNQKNKWEQGLDKLFDILQNVPRLIFSYGGMDGIREAGKIEEMIRARRGNKLEKIEIPYHYSIRQFVEKRKEQEMEILFVSDVG